MKMEKYEDNGERAIFYARGVLETVKKLRWNPDIVHCHGWMSAIVPLFIKKAYYDEPSFRDTKVIYSVYEKGFESNLSTNFTNQLLFKGITENDIPVKQPVNFTELNKLAIAYSDGVIQNSENINPEIMSYAHSLSIPVIDYQHDQTYADLCNSLYNKVCGDANK